MSRSLLCERGSPDKKLRSQSDHFWSTSNKAEIKFLGNIVSFFKGEQEIQVTNCAVQSAVLYYRPHNLEMLSPIYNVKHCKYQTEACTLEDGTTITWTADCQNGSCSSCDYEKLKDWNGEYTTETEDTPLTWTSEDKELALTFSRNPERAKGCDNTLLRLSDQGYGIPAHHYKEMAWKRQKREVRESQIAAGLTASQIHTSRAIQQLFKRECMRNYRTEDPTLLARRMSNKTVQARWLTTTELEVWSCIELNFNQLEFRSTEKCYKFIPVSVKFPEKDIKISAFLDPVLKILSSSSIEADCLHFRFHLVQKGDNIWYRIDSKTGKSTLVPPGSVYQVYETLPDSGGVLEIKPLIFHEMILTNYTEIFPHVDELLRFQNWKAEVTQKINEKASNHGALPYGIKGLALQYLEYYWGIFKDNWFMVASGYATFLLIRDVLLPLVLAYRFTPLIQALNSVKPRPLVRRKPRQNQSTEWEEEMRPVIMRTPSWTRRTPRLMLEGPSFAESPQAEEETPFSRPRRVHIQEIE